MQQEFDWSHSWYEPGDWELPQWWTAGVTVRQGFATTFEDQQYFYNSNFVRNVLKHEGGMNRLPKPISPNRAIYEGQAITLRDSLRYTQ